jgi:FlaA1/EpsC-like NDP-sugar epimerase
MTIQEACSLVIEAGKMGTGGQIYILDMGKPIKILDLAHKILEEARKDIPIKMIDLRPMEKTSEQLMTEEEARTAIKQGKFYVL